METHSVAATLVGIPKLGYNIAEAEVISGFSRTQLYRFIRAGELPTLKMGRGRRVVTRSDLEALMDRRKSTEAARP